MKLCTKINKYGCICKHPCMPIEEFNDEYILPLLEKASKENKPLILLGDFNELIKLDNLLDKTVTKQAQQHCKQTGIRTHLTRYK